MRIVIDIQRLTTPPKGHIVDTRVRNNGILIRFYVVYIYIYIKKQHYIYI